MKKQIITVLVLGAIAAAAGQLQNAAAHLLPHWKLVVFTGLVLYGIDKKALTATTLMITRMFCWLRTKRMPCPMCMRTSEATAAWYSGLKQLIAFWAFCKNASSIVGMKNK